LRTVRRAVSELKRGGPGPGCGWLKDY
jgi:hypothetical protein